MESCLDWNWVDNSVFYSGNKRIAFCLVINLLCVFMCLLENGAGNEMVQYLHVFSRAFILFYETHLLKLYFVEFFVRRLVILLLFFQFCMFMQERGLVAPWQCVLVLAFILVLTHRSIHYQCVRTACRVTVNRGYALIPLPPLEHARSDGTECQNIQQHGRH